MKPATDYSQLSEPTKVVRGSLETWLRCTLHLIPLAFAAVLLYINIAKLYWFPVSGINVFGDVHISANAIINSFQLVAKAYEILVITSLGAIALAVFKRQLVHGAVPFGLLTSAYRISDIFYVTSGSFWSAAPSNLTLVLLFLVCVILCTLIGPASAILIVPKLGWSPLSDAFSNIYMPMYISGQADLLWPTVLNGSIYAGRWEYCAKKIGSYGIYCPASGFPHIYAWAAGWETSELSENITFDDPTTATSRRLHMFSGDSSVASAGTILTSLTTVTTSAIGKLQNYFTANDTGKIHSTEEYKLTLNSSFVNYQPLVNAKCKVWRREAYDNVPHVPDLYYPSSELNCYSNNTDDDCHRMRDLAKHERVFEEYWSYEDFRYRFSVLDDNSTSVLVFTSSIPYLNEGKEDMRIFACTYMAHWIPSTPVLQPNKYRSIESNITDLSIFSNKTIFNQSRPKVTVGPSLRIRKSWKRYLDLGEYKVVNEGSDEGAIGNIAAIIGALMEERDDIGYFGPGGPLKQPEAEEVARITMEKVTGAIVTDAIARTASYATQYIARPSHPGAEDIVAVNLAFQNAVQDKEYEFFANQSIHSFNKGWENDTGLSPQEALEEWGQDRVRLDFDAERFGYGYGRSGSAMVFAIVVNIAYMLFVVCYFLVTVCLRSDTIRGFGDLQDLIRLAWTSPPVPEMEQQVIKVSDKRLWGKGVAVGARFSGTIEMQLVDSERDSKLSRLAKGEGYY